MNKKILVVDDEKEIADLIELYLRNENYDVYKFYDGPSAIETVKKIEFDVAILDIMLPITNGFEICQAIRERFNYPVIMLTAKDAQIDKITGLSIGADDYITKPFHPLELVARVKAQVRRCTKYNLGYSSLKSDVIITHGGLVLNLQTHECFLNERILALTPTEFSILQILLQKKGSVVSAESLFHSIWNEEYYNKNNNTITVHIRHLREKMQDTLDKPKYIKTVWGVGYKIENQ